MPSTYAHLRFGKEVKEFVFPEGKKVIEEYPELFLIGLHGPDILFYYHPLFPNRINAIGYGTHEKSGKEFFENAARVIKKNKGNAAYLSYIYGFICHFVLDVRCHRYIDEKIAESGVSHAEIEVEFDRELMVRDGFDPITRVLTNHINPSDFNAGIISAFFEGTTEKQVKKALKGMIFNNNLLIAPSHIKRWFVSLLLKISGNYKEMHGLMVNFEKNPQCEDSTEKLTNLYIGAVPNAAQLIREFYEYLNELGSLNMLYQYSFGSKLIENEGQ